MSDEDLGYLTRSTLYGAKTGGLIFAIPSSVIDGISTYKETAKRRINPHVRIPMSVTNGIKSGLKGLKKGAIIGAIGGGIGGAINLHKRNKEKKNANPKK